MRYKYQSIRQVFEHISRTMLHHQLLYVLRNIYFLASTFQHGSARSDLECETVRLVAMLVDVDRAVIHATSKLRRNTDYN